MKREGYYRIGEVSKITGISKDTLHFYNKIGLVVPDYTDPENQYRYYSRWNMWQLDIVALCRKLSIPLEQVKRMMTQRDNGKVVEMMMAYREEALRRSEYYRQVAEDLLWYKEENQAMEENSRRSEVQVKWLPAETVLAGSVERNAVSYHADLQQAAKEELAHARSIRRKYGYVLDGSQMAAGQVVKVREYLRLPDTRFTCVAPENRYTLPEGYYAVVPVRIENEQADFTPLLDWLDANGEAPEVVFAEEMGLQLFGYLSNYACEVKVLLKNEKRGLTV